MGKSCRKTRPHYESVHNLIGISCEKTIELWEKIESSLYTKEDHSVLK